jgi:hypothetical protein
VSRELEQRRTFLSLDASGDCSLFKLSYSFTVDCRRAAASTQTLAVNYQMNRFVWICFVACLVAGCTKHAQPTPVANDIPQPSPIVVLSTAEANFAFDSPDSLTKALERRWPLPAIRTYCIPERRHNHAFQNLVAYSPRWEGTLYSGGANGFDKITWYASTKKGRVDQYSLGAYRGKDFWLLEIGDENTVQSPPEYSPSPNNPRFVGHR